MLFHAIAALLATAALASYVNHRYLRLPTTIGLMVIALVMSVALAMAAHFGLASIAGIVGPLQAVNFSDLLLHGMLAYLLFAGALHVDLNDLRSEAPAVALLSTVGVVITAFVAGSLFWAAAQMLGLGVPYIYALLFGSLIAPTDPIAVLAIMKQVAAPKRLQTHVTCESLFNDGVGVVLFLTIAGLIASGEEPRMGEAVMALATEALGGAALGFAAGWGIYRLDGC
jgi:CPA1 family monovalent cation:H+ antiporter